MKKYMAVLLGICICLFTSMTVGAAGNSAGSTSENTIKATVPNYHKVTIEAEHAAAYYQDAGEEGDVFPVERFSKPQFLISAEEGWRVKRVLLNGDDVTAQVTDGILTIPSVYEDQVITIETKAISAASETGNEGDSTPNASETGQNRGNASGASQTGKNRGIISGVSENGKNKDTDLSDTQIEEKQEDTAETEETMMKAETEEQEPEQNSARIQKVWTVVLCLLIILIALVILIVRAIKKKRLERASDNNQHE